MSWQKFVACCLVILFIGLGFGYTVMGFGSPNEFDEGLAVTPRFDRLKCLNMAKSITRGDLSFYKVPYKPHFMSDEGRFYLYPPLSGILVAPLILLSEKMGLEGRSLFDISILPFIFLSGLAAYLVLDIRTKYKGSEALSDHVVSMGIFLFSGFLFYSVVVEGKFEGVVAFFILLGIFFLPNKKVLSGICFGLAVCTKQIAILALIPTFFVLWREANVKAMLKWVFSLAIVTFVVLLPFLLASGLENLYLAMFRNFDFYKIQPATTVGYLYAALKSLFGDDRGTIQEFLQFNANKLVLLMCVLISFWIVLRRRLTLSASEQYAALLVICSFLYITLGKFFMAGYFEIFPTYLFLLWAVLSGETLWGGIVLLLQSFIVTTWPSALYKNQLLLLLYFAVTFYVYHKSLSRGRATASESAKAGV